MAWNDDRIFNYTDDNEKKLSKLIVPKYLMEHLWKPDIFIYGSKSGYIHQTSMENKMMWLEPATGDFDYSLKMTAKIQCELHLEFFPFDEQTCELIFQSCKYEQKSFVRVKKF